MTAYYAGDIPAEDLVIEPARNGEAIGLDAFDDVEVEYRDFAGAIVDVDGFIATIDDGTVLVEWPDVTPFEDAGLYTLTVILLDTETGARERIEPVYIVAQDAAGEWHTLDSARLDWADAKAAEDVTLFKALLLARNQVEAFGSTYTEPADRRLAFRQGQIMQAQNLYNSSKVDPSTGGLDGESFVIRPFPLDWMVKQVLRPKRVVPAVG